MEDQIRIANEDFDCVFVSKEDDKVRLSIHIFGGSARIRLSPQQAREVVAAINAITEEW